eukprot:TRINITY_DN32568_c0_g1_i5.p1 TRINITY_DN32568_c0_g1~~TRINITY_DN32568_c0_g1_i5.p1  ORF type:complete len:258 (-),score=45.36 TRINITY_DN32568_c0_g1_i5:121-894(-)
MELPHIGEHCTESSCKQLDYLPMRCDACNQLYCKDHLKYDDHSCNSKYKKDVQVPVCPLCNAPVPVARGTLPDLAVSAHIDQACKQKVKEKVFTNRCNKARCKKKELVKITCDACKLNFCLTHRHPKDHDCEGAAAASRLAAAAAQNRAVTARNSQPTSSTQSKITSFFSGPFRTDNPSRAAAASSATAASSASRPTAVTARSIQNGMSEDEALAAALAASMADVPSPPAVPTAGLSQEEQDRMLAQALQAGIISFS